MLSFFTVSNCIIFPCSYFVLSFMLYFLGCYHLRYHLMLSFLTVSKCYHFYVIIFPSTSWVLSFMLSFDVIIYCYHFPPFFLFPENVTHSNQKSKIWELDNSSRDRLVSPHPPTPPPPLPPPPYKFPDYLWDTSHSQNP